MGKKQRIFYFHKIFKSIWLWSNYNYISTASTNEKPDRVGKEIGAQYCNNKFIKYRPLSPYYPDAKFNAGNAMGRNKYIYVLAKSSVVIHSGLKGGTWEGAKENLKK